MQNEKSLQIEPKCFTYAHPHCFGYKNLFMRAL